MTKVQEIVCTADEMFGITISSKSDILNAVIVAGNAVKGSRLDMEAAAIVFYDRFGMDYEGN